jgi:hypothetical protein
MQNKTARPGIRCHLLEAQTTALQTVRDKPGEIVGSTRLHTGGDFFAKQLKQKVGHNKIHQRLAALVQDARKDALWHTGTGRAAKRKNGIARQLSTARHERNERNFAHATGIKHFHIHSEFSLSSDTLLNPALK